MHSFGSEIGWISGICIGLQSIEWIVLHHGLPMFASSIKICLRCFCRWIFVLYAWFDGKVQIMQWTTWWAITSNWNVKASKYVSIFGIISKRVMAEYAVFKDIWLLPYINVSDSGTEYIIWHVVHVLLPTLEPSIHNCTLFFLLWSGAVKKKRYMTSSNPAVYLCNFCHDHQYKFFSCLCCTVKSRFWGGQGMYVSLLFFYLSINWIKKYILFLTKKWKVIEIMTIFVLIH